MYGHSCQGAIWYGKLAEFLPLKPDFHRKFGLVLLAINHNDNYVCLNIIFSLEISISFFPLPGSRKYSSALTLVITISFSPFWSKWRKNFKSQPCEAYCIFAKLSQKSKLKLQLLAEMVMISINPTTQPPTHPPGQVWTRQNRAKLRKQKLFVYMSRP